MFAIFGRLGKNSIPLSVDAAMSTTSTGSIRTSSTNKPPDNNVLRILAFGDSLTAGTSPPSNELYPYAPYLETALKKKSGKLLGK